MKKLKNNLKIQIYKNITKANYLIIIKKENISNYKFFTRLIGTQLDILEYYKKKRFKFPLVLRSFDFIDTFKVNFLNKDIQTKVIFIKFNNFIMFNKLTNNVLSLENKINQHKFIILCFTLKFLNFLKIKQH